MMLALPPVSPGPIACGQVDEHLNETEALKLFRKRLDSVWMRTLALHCSKPCVRREGKPLEELDFRNSMERLAENDGTKSAHFS